MDRMVTTRPLAASNDMTANTPPFLEVVVEDIVEEEDRPFEDSTARGAVRLESLGEPVLISHRGKRPRHIGPSCGFYVV
jgi:hypothetical protein